MSVSRATCSTAVASRPLPDLVLVDGLVRRRFSLDHTPFSIGREANKDVVIDPARLSVSRDHAEIYAEGADYILVDRSKHGTYVNGEKTERRKLNHNDRIDLGAPGGPYIVFLSSGAQTGVARDLLSKISGIEVQGATSDLAKLTFFLEAARKLNTTGVVDEILITLIESTLRLTRAERGYVFLRDPDGRQRLVAGRNIKGDPLLDDTRVSHSIIGEAARSASTFIISDAAKTPGISDRQSVVDFELRTVICIPLRKPQVKGMPSVTPTPGPPETIGVLYLDSHYASRDLSKVSKDILDAIAAEAASLVENARLVRAEEAAHRVQQELTLAASIQQQLMAVAVPPELPFASIQAQNLPCKDVGGDFFDAIVTSEGVAVVVTDVSGKGISAALLASVLQGVVYSQVCARIPLEKIVSFANRFICQRSLGANYATMVIAHLKANGEVEFANCGHVPPLLISNGTGTRIEESNPPVGLILEAQYETVCRKLRPGDRLLFVTDGVTEAQNRDGKFYGYERLEKAATSSVPFQEVFGSLQAFRAGTPLNDDCTVFEVTYQGAA